MKRLIHESDDAFERALLRSVRIDEPPAGNLERAAIALAGAAAVVTAATATASALGTVTTSTAPKAAVATKLGALAVWKWIGLGVVAGAVTTVGAASTIHALRSDEKENAPPAASVTLPSKTAPTMNPIASSPPPLESSVPLPAVSEPEPTPSAVVRRDPVIPTTNVPEPIAPVPTALTPAPNASALAAEAAALDRARQALAKGSPSTALSLLDAYERDVPTHALAPDADVLRIEAEEASGQRADAARLAAKFLREHPSDPHAERVKRLLDRLSKP